MKTIGIIGAMEEEITNIKDNLDIISTKNIVGLDFYMGKMNGHNVVLVRSGIGKVNASICTQVIIDFYAVDYIINVGVAGAVNKNLKIGDIVISEDAMYHDFDATVFGYKVGEIPRMEGSTFLADTELIDIAKKACENQNIKNIHVGRIVSGDQFVSSSEIKSKLRETFKASCVEMEGAGIAHTCFLNKMPFIVIRAISDNADEGDSCNYDEFCVNSAVKASSIVKGIVDLL